MDQKCTESAFHIFQSIEMGKAYEDELCITPNTSASILDLELMQQEPSSIFSWKLVKQRQHPHRRYTVSHSCSAPPAPPSTPTSLTANGTPTPSPTLITTKKNIDTYYNSIASADDERLNSLLYMLDYAPKYKKKLKEQRRTDLELAELLNVFTISGSTSGGSSCKNLNETNSNKLPTKPKRGISDASRVIRKYDASTKIFKIHRNPQEFFREPDEDSVSAPEYDTDEKTTRYFQRRCWPVVMNKRELQKRNQDRRLARFQHNERMETIVDNFEAAMNIKEA